MLAPRHLSTVLKTKSAERTGIAKIIHHKDFEFERVGHSVQHRMQTKVGLLLFLLKSPSQPSMMESLS